MKASIVLGLVLLVVAGVAAFLMVATQSNAPEPDNGSAQVAALQKKLSESELEREAIQASLDAAEARNRELEAAAEEAKQEAAAVTAPADPDADEVTAEEESAERKRSLEEIRELIRNNPNASAQLKALAELMYADFLNSVDLDPELKAELRRLLTESMIESVSLNRFALTEGDVPWSEVRGWELNERAYLDAKIKELVPEDAYDAWTDYFQDIDAHQLEGNLRNQIRAVASGLTPENFDLALQVAVEEFRAQQMLLEQSNHPFTTAENIHYQLRAMDAMRERLSALLTPDQMSEVENWLTMANRLLSSQLPDDK